MPHVQFKLFIFFLVVLLSACNIDQSKENSNNRVEKSTPLVWHPAGGAATVKLNQELPFLQFANGLDLAELASASQGRELFVAQWEVAPGVRPTLDGLGPLAIAPACSSCHLATGRAESLKENGDVGVGLLFRLRDEHGSEDVHYGGQLQTFATSGNSEGQVTWQLDDKNKPEFSLVTHTMPLTEGIQLGPRLSPQLVGIGLLELVPDYEILSYVDEYDANQDGISGKAHWHEIEGQPALGRFGWKAMQTSLKRQTAGALQQDMGLTTSINPHEPCTVHQSICGDSVSGGAIVDGAEINSSDNGLLPEVSDHSLSAINNFLTVLAVPERRIENQETFDRGSLIFKNIGCSQCHRPTLITGESLQYPLLNNQLIYPYTDLLLHDMGDQLSDGIKEGEALPSEWRTPPLWSLGLIEQVLGSRFLHDGRAATIEQAIIWHGGEALNSKNKFDGLSETQKNELLIFLRAI